MKLNHIRWNYVLHIQKLIAITDLLLMIAMKFLFLLFIYINNFFNFKF
jgi:hypothetical protein